MGRKWTYSKELKKIKDEWNKIPITDQKYDGVIGSIISYFERVERDLIREKEKGGNLADE